MLQGQRASSANVDKIKISKAEVVVSEGEKPKLLALNEIVEEKKKQGKQATDPQKGPAGNSIDTIYSLFLNHLLRPREWSAQFDGNGYFAFRREHIISLAEECQRIIAD